MSLQPELGCHLDAHLYREKPNISFLTSHLINGVWLVNGEEVLGFATNPESWTLVSPEPAFTIHSDWQRVLPELKADPPLEAWRLAWQAWCHVLFASSEFVYVN